MGAERDFKHSAERDFKHSASQSWFPSGRFAFHVREVNEFSGSPLGPALEFHHMQSRDKQVRDVELINMAADNAILNTDYKATVLWNIV